MQDKEMEKVIMRAIDEAGTIVKDCSNNNNNNIIREFKNSTKRLKTYSKALLSLIYNSIFT